MTQLTIWWLAIRPKTLSISVTPVLLGSALAWHDQHVFSLLTFISTLVAALAIQIGTNLYNDAADFEKGADNNERLGPKRAAQQGWLSAQQIKRGAFISFIVAFFFGIYLAYLGGLGIIILGLTSILCGYAYTGGSKPIAYSPLGELFVIIFFGFAAVGGSYYLQTATLHSLILIIASTLGVFAAAILLVNNYRDLDGDEKVAKLTLVHYIHRPNARILYVIMIAYPYIILVFLLSYYSWFILLPLLCLPMAFQVIQLFLSLDISPKLNHVLAKTAQLQFIYSVLLSSAIIINSYSLTAL